MAEELDLNDLPDREQIRVCRKAENRMKWANRTPFVGERQEEVQQAQEALENLQCNRLEVKQ